MKLLTWRITKSLASIFIIYRGGAGEKPLRDLLWHFFPEVFVAWTNLKILGRAMRKVKFRVYFKDRSSMVDS